MIKGKLKIKLKKDKSAAVGLSLKKLSGMEVLVGVPEETSDRKSGDINNAQLVMIHTHGVPSEKIKTDGGSAIHGVATSLYLTSKGSPLWKIPPRPIIEPAVEAEGNKEKLEEGLRIAAELFIEDRVQEAITTLNEVGFYGVEIVKDWFEDPRNNWPPAAESTVLAGIKKRYKNKKKIKEAMAKYKSGEEDIKQLLVDTGQMRSAITYVVNLEK